MLDIVVSVCPSRMRAEGARKFYSDTLKIFMGLEAGGHTSMHILTFSMKVKQCCRSSEIKVVALNHPQKICLFVTFWSRKARGKFLFCTKKNIVTVCSRRQADLLYLRGVGPPLYPKTGQESLPCALFAIVIGTGLRWESMRNLLPQMKTKV